MNPSILAACSPGEVRIAVWGDGELQDFALWRPGAPDGVGDLHRGRVLARVPALAGAFVALADAEGFLPDSQGGAGAAAGQLLGVRVTRAAQAGKGPRLTALLDAEEAARSAAGPARLLCCGLSPLRRLAGRYPDVPVLLDDPAVAAELRPALGPRLRLVPRAFDEATEARVEALAAAEVELPGGGRLRICPTPALTAIDLDSGAASADRQGKGAAQMAFNRAAMPVLAREIRLRNLSGAILVDFAGLSPRRRAGLGGDLARALEDDPLRPRLLGFTALGLAEIVRARVHPPLHELLAGPLAAGLAALRRVVAEAAGGLAQRPVLRAAPAIVTALRADPCALAQLARRSVHPLILRADPALPGWRLEFEDG